MTVELSPQSIEAIARRVLELLDERGSQPGGTPPPASAQRRAGRSGKRLAPPVQLLPIRGFDENDKWVDVEFDADGNPIDRT
jgi:hypothetical protein